MSRLSKTEVALIIAALLYVVSPIDVIPEAIAGPLGLGDDAAILGLIAAMIMRAAQRPNSACATNWLWPGAYKNPCFPMCFRQFPGWT